jgi:hypothetical protein
MRNWIRGFTLVLATITASGHAAAMNSARHCTVLAGEKLPVSSGGAQQLCESVEQAIGTAAPNVAYQVQITVLSPARLSATLVVKGRTLPEQKFAIMDRELNRGAIERFAHSLAEAVAKAAKS